MHRYCVIILRSTEEGDDQNFFAGTLEDFIHHYEREGVTPYSGDLSHDVVELICPDLIDPSEEWPIGSLIEVEYDTESFDDADVLIPHCAGLPEEEQSHRRNHFNSAFVCYASWRRITHEEYPKKIYFKWTRGIYENPEAAGAVGCDPQTA